MVYAYAYTYTYAYTYESYEYTPKGFQRDSRKVSDLKVCSEHPETASLYLLLRVRT